MLDRLIPLFLLIGVHSGPAAAEEASQGAPMQIALSDSVSVRFTVPPSSFSQAKPSLPGKAAELEMYSMNGMHKLKVSILVPQGRDIPEDELKKMVQVGAEERSASWGAEVPTIEEQRTDAAYYAYVSHTDAKLVDKPVPPGEWRHMTMGMSNNKSFITTAWLYSQEKDHPSHAQALNAWLTMTGTTDQAMHEVAYYPPGDGEPLVFSAPAMNTVEIIHGPTPTGMDLKGGEAPALRVTAQRDDGLSFTVETTKFNAKAPTSRKCLTPYMVNVLNSWNAQPGVAVPRKSIKVDDRGELARLAFTVVGKASRKDTRKMQNVAYLLGRPGHCSMVHFMSVAGTEESSAQLEQVDKSVTVGK